LFLEKNETHMIAKQFIWS